MELSLAGLPLPITVRPHIPLSDDKSQLLQTTANLLVDVPMSGLRLQWPASGANPDTGTRSGPYSAVIGFALMASDSHPNSLSCTTAPTFATGLRANPTSRVSSASDDRAARPCLRQTFATRSASSLLYGPAAKSSFANRAA